MKSMADRITAAVGLVIAFPVLAMITLAIWLSDGAPVFFAQDRPGRNGRPFRLVKFRTMRNAVDPTGMVAPDDQRITRLGRILRTTSLDELPQLWNVLRGELSLVGPRPLLMKYLERYTSEQARRHEVLPGLTGWAQINGRNAISWEEKFALDTWYVEHWSLTLDFRILLMTFIRVLKRQGISSDGHATMPEFAGSRSESKTDERP